MTLGLSFIRLVSVLENPNFVALALFFDMSNDGSALNIGNANRSSSAADKKNFVKSVFVSGRYV